MTKLLTDLRGLMQVEGTEQARTGEVIAVKEASVIVKTLKGLKEYPTISPTQFKVGDKVRLSGDIAVSRIASSAALPTYSV